MPQAPKPPMPNLSDGLARWATLPDGSFSSSIGRVWRRADGQWMGQAGNNLHAIGPYTRVGTAKAQVLLVYRLGVRGSADHA